jgi:ABC-type antimicrobial peptide transport system permease subunit
VGGFAVVAALLASIGVYGVLAYTVAERRQEIGIRMALGATRASIVRQFLTQGVWLAVIGLVAGVAAALGVSRWIGSLLFQVEASDPWTMAAAGAAVVVAVGLASYVPARRAARVDPLVALRAE